MTLPLLPDDYALGDTPDPDEINAMLAHLRAANIEQFHTAVNRDSLVFPVPTNSSTAVEWQSVVNGRNGMSWSAGVPTRLTVPADGDGWWSVSCGIEFQATASGFRALSLLVDGTTLLPGFSIPGSTSVHGALNVQWELELAAGQYVEAIAWQNSGGSINIRVSGTRPQISARRVRRV